MARKQAETALAGETVAGESASAADAHRRYNRAYMRRWRANPLHRDRELAMRLEWYYARKQRKAQRKQAKYTNDRGELVCAICWRRRPVRQISRLQVSESSRTGFEEVLIPYCGEC